MRKHLLLAGTAAFAVALAAPAHAFDKVNWTWDSDVDVTIDSDWKIDNNLDPSGLVKVQDFQFQVGNVTASTYGRDVNNYRGSEGGEGEMTFTFEGEVFDNGADIIGEDGDVATFDRSASGDLAGINENEIPTDSTFSSEGGSLPAATGVDGGIVDAEYVDGSQITVNGGTTFNQDGTPESPNNINGATEDGEIGGVIFDVVIPFDAIDFPDTLDARTELASVDYQATAVANNESITSNVSTSVHTGQFAWGGFEDGTSVDDEVSGTFGTLYDTDGNKQNTGNLGVATSLSMIVAGMTGEITKGRVSASTNVADMLNTQVLADATAVVNNKSIELDGRTDDDRVLMADVSQASFMDSSARTNVQGVTLQQYSNLGRIDPVVQGAATAIGNNLSITVE